MWYGQFNRILTSRPTVSCWLIDRHNSREGIFAKSWTDLNHFGWRRFNSVFIFMLRRLILHISGSGCNLTMIPRRNMMLSTKFILRLPFKIKLCSFCLLLSNRNMCIYTLTCGTDLRRLFYILLQQHRVSVASAASDFDHKFAHKWCYILFFFFFFSFFDEIRRTENGIKDTDGHQDVTVSRYIRINMRITHLSTFHMALHISPMHHFSMKISE